VIEREIIDFNIPNSPSSNPQEIVKIKDGKTIVKKMNTVDFKDKAASKSSESSDIIEVKRKDTKSQTSAKLNLLNLKEVNKDL